MNPAFKDIPNSFNWIKVEEVNKGWSKDKKYYVHTDDDTSLLLRTSDITMFNRKKQEFEEIRQLEKMGLIMSRPVDFGVCNEGHTVYGLYTWVEGEDAQQVIPHLTVNQQYHLGIEAGQSLRTMHQIPAGDGRQSWAESYNAKIDLYISNYYACGIPLKGANRLVDYISHNRHLLENRPQSFQHGDYHIGNMIVTPSGSLGIIDFNRMGHGDPWQEFNRISWCAGQSHSFASGRINGYFHNQVPDLFFKLMALYVASNQLSSIHWAIPFGQEEVKNMLERAEQVLEWYDGFRTYIPNWYKPDSSTLS
ncbi:phosphotransferase family protein [Paenibacillus sp. ACRRX]|uniref:aminoglycoside phosphotransferase family protein n=1 Tax=Paenibacillus sp. ACRRX TaxID=2918206 RepID=UPI001EF4C986|nr:phosphotransferase family protein [Paenibacillus sp. ACRRX]